MLKKVIAAALLFGMIGNAMATAQTGSTKITAIYTGWGSESFSVDTPSGLPVVNPAGCPSTDLYSTNSSLPNFKMVYAAALIALQNKSNVSLIISGTECSGGRPEVIGITMYSAT